MLMFVSEVPAVTSEAAPTDTTVAMVTTGKQMAPLVTSCMVA